MTSYNIIGDIHGRNCWKQLVDEHCVNIFVGDYFDPYDLILFDELSNNFLEILELKKRIPDKVVLLYGNHDYDYLPGIDEKTKRYDSWNAQAITKLFVESSHLFEGIAYAIGEEYLVSHAGVTKRWLDKYLPDVTDYKPSNIARVVNDLWSNNKEAFGFNANAEPLDFYGESAEHSPIWVRPIYFGYCNLYRGTNIMQIVGHSRVENITEKDNAIFIDCLETTVQSKRINI